MPVKVLKEGNLYSAVVTEAGGGLRWQTPHPMPTNELWLALKAAACTPEEIVEAFRGVPRPSGYYHIADEMMPGIDAALAGRRAVPVQKAFVEAWIALALECEPSAAPLEDILEQADSINIAVPTTDEVAWAFLRLRERGWLTIEGGKFGLTAEARRKVGSVVGKMAGFHSAKHLEEWLSANPL